MLLEGAGALLGATELCAPPVGTHQKMESKEVRANESRGGAART